MTHEWKECSLLPSPAWFIPLIIAFVIMFFFAINAFAETMQASWYSMDSLKKEGTYKYSKGVMANGKYFNDAALTCASCDFPLKTRLQITNIENPCKKVEVTVTDKTNKRFKGERIDLSKGAFSKIADLKQGLISVTIEVAK